jgi:hypothetical protein
MKSSCILVSGARIKSCLLPAVVCFAASTLVPHGMAGDVAAKSDKAEKKELRQKVKAFDVDNSKELTAAEREALRKAFAIDPSLKPLDTNGDGKLDDAEITAFNIHKSGGKLQDSGKLKGSGKLDKKK